MKRRKEPLVKPVQIGISKIKDDTTGLTRIAKYSDIPKDKRWSTLLEFIPVYYDLVELKIKDYHKNKIGWFNGSEWTGLRLKATDVVLAWKKTKDYN